MTDPEKLTALKKAYADTILNTAKEAAARVMISEKKARGYQQELVAVRDEALRTCLRLKQMYDSKVKEAEMISLKKQQKIEELEAQLGEAEDIVGDLRMELRECRYHLEILANGRQMNLGNEEKNPNEAVSLVREDSSNLERSVVANGIKPHLSDRDISINRCSYKENKDPCHHTLPSILSRRREAEALERKVASGDCHDVESLTSSKTEAAKEEERVNDMELSTNATFVSPSEKQCVAFKRKREKDASSNSSPEGGSSFSQDDESRNWRQKTGEKDNSYLDSFNTESCRDSRRVAQVARQLLPFSEKKVLQ
ncbi:hypothetical protein EUTSA_v10008269mg [Eutrema salsugineum]|uniref:Uncharacterized protein n=1 Tax=Eutrema salsugineum TaxID=72664 RepID=V4KB18_EUTSA|nr:uncharacterized protein LOC18993015 [Eutrema salsugineum]ESQ34895.1 hypothetical protein EUTSA_v10008269mg [Eutrema salsugineum]